MNDGVAELAREARVIMRRVLTCALGTLEPDGGAPAVSLLAVATDVSCRPVFLASDLAHHTRNFGRDSRVSALFDGTGNLAIPLEGGRVSVKGTLRLLEDESAHARYLRRHADARDYAGFGDFNFYGMDVESAYFVGGFGKIHTLPADVVLLPETGLLADFTAAERDILDHMNEDHTDALALYAGLSHGDPHGSWTMTGIDPEGFDLRSGGSTLRIAFQRPLNSPGESRQAFKKLSEIAREKSRSGN